MDSSIADQRAYEFLIRELEAKNWVEKVLNEELQFSVADFVENLRDGMLFTLAASFQYSAIHEQVSYCASLVLALPRILLTSS